MSGDRKYATIEGKLVAEGHPDARFVASNTAGEVDEAFIARLKEAAGVAKADEKAEKAEAKAAPKAADKAVKAAANK